MSFIGIASDLISKTIDTAGRQLLNVLIRIQDNVSILQPPGAPELDDSAYDRNFFRAYSRNIPTPPQSLQNEHTQTCTFKVVSSGKSYIASRALLTSKSYYHRGMFYNSSDWAEGRMEPILVKDETILDSEIAFSLFLKACAKADYEYRDDDMDFIWKHCRNYTPSTVPKKILDTSEDIIRTHVMVYLLADRFQSDDVQKLAFDRLFEALFKLTYSVEFIVELIEEVYAYTFDPQESTSSGGQTSDRSSSLSRVVIRNMLLQSVQKRYSLSSQADKRFLETSTFFNHDGSLAQDWSEMIRRAKTVR